MTIPHPPRTSKRPELLSPAGNLRNLRYALAYGADAVYAGMPRYSLRVRNNDFRDLKALQQGIEQTHAAGKQFFLATNIIPHGAKLKTFLDDMAPIMALRPDALIMADPGLIMLVREHWPDMAIHLSVQANTMNAQSVQFWQSIGLQRVILSRELSLDQIDEIRQTCPDIELEVFVHGALCMAHSGRCLLSGYFNHRDANQGSCTNACRWDYKLGDKQQAQQTLSMDALNSANQGCGSVGDMPRHPEADQIYFLEEKQRPGELLPIFEDEHGTYIMNSKDLRAVEHVQRLIDIGIDCLKIEGRTKSHYYTARTTSVYRRAIDDAIAGHDLNPVLLAELSGLANRGYTDGFLERHTPQATQNYLDNASKNDGEIFIGEVIGNNDDTPSSPSNDPGWYKIEVKNGFHRGDQIELITPAGNQRFTLDQLKDPNGRDIDSVPGNGRQVWIKMPTACDNNALLSRHLRPD